MNRINNYNSYFFIANRLSKNKKHNNCIFGHNKYLVKNETLFDGKHYEFNFSNEYGASIIRHKYSYGHEQGLYELAVLHGCELCSSYVIGWLTPKEVFNILDKIKNLK